MSLPSASGTKHQQFKRLRLRCQGLALRPLCYELVSLQLRWIKRSNGRFECLACLRCCELSFEGRVKLCHSVSQFVLHLLFVACEILALELARGHVRRPTDNTGRYVLGIVR